MMQVLTSSQKIITHNTVHHFILQRTADGDMMIVLQNNFVTFNCLYFIQRDEIRFMDLHELLLRELFLNGTQCEVWITT